jgi:hypothetical protein
MKALVVVTPALTPVSLESAPLAGQTFQFFQVDYQIVFSGDLLAIRS